MAPEKEQRIIVCSSRTGKIHVLHWDYGEWLLSETDGDFPGGSVDFDFWMPCPNQPERSKREDLTSTTPLPKDLEKRLVEQWKKEMLS